MSEKTRDRLLYLISPLLLLLLWELLLRNGFGCWHLARETSYQEGDCHYCVFHNNTLRRT